jgi:hypothetical protein
MIIAKFDKNARVFYFFYDKFFKKYQNHPIKFINCHQISPNATLIKPILTNQNGGLSDSFSLEYQKIPCYKTRDLRLS